MAHEEMFPDNEFAGQKYDDLAPIDPIVYKTDTRSQSNLVQPPNPTAERLAALESRLTNLESVVTSVTDQLHGLPSVLNPIAEPKAGILDRLSKLEQAIDWLDDKMATEDESNPIPLQCRVAKLEQTLVLHRATSDVSDRLQSLERRLDTWFGGPNSVFKQPEGFYGEGITAILKRQIAFGIKQPTLNRCITPEQLRSVRMEAVANNIPEFTPAYWNYVADRINEFLRVGK